MIQFFQGGYMFGRSPPAIKSICHCSSAFWIIHQNLLCQIFYHPTIHFQVSAQQLFGGSLSNRSAMSFASSFVKPCLSLYHSIWWCTISTWCGLLGTRLSFGPSTATWFLGHFGTNLHRQAQWEDDGSRESRRLCQGVLGWTVFLVSFCWCEQGVFGRKFWDVKDLDKHAFGMWFWDWTWSLVIVLRSLVSLFSDHWWPTFLRR